MEDRIGSGTDRGGFIGAKIVQQEFESRGKMFSFVNPVKKNIEKREMYVLMV